MGHCWAKVLWLMSNDSEINERLHFFKSTFKAKVYSVLDILQSPWLICYKSPQASSLVTIWHLIEVVILGRSIIYWVPTLWRPLSLSVTCVSLKRTARGHLFRLCHINKSIKLKHPQREQHPWLSFPLLNKTGHLAVTGAEYCEPYVLPFIKSPLGTQNHITVTVNVQCDGRVLD